MSLFSCIFVSIDIGSSSTDALVSIHHHIHMYIFEFNQVFYIYLNQSLQIHLLVKSGNPGEISLYRYGSTKYVHRVLKSPFKSQICRTYT